MTSGWDQRALSWLRASAQARASDVIWLDDKAFGVFDSRFPRSHDNNRLIVGDIGSAAEAVDVHRTATRVFSERGLPYHELSAGQMSEDAVQALIALGYQVLPVQVLAVDPAGYLDRSSDPEDERVVDVPTAAWEDHIRRTWRADDPTMDDATVEDLTARRHALDSAGRVDRLGVMDGERAVALLELTFGGDRSPGLVEVDSLIVDTNHRRRGHGDVLLHEAARRAVEVGADLLVLQALALDWPVQWYRRRGFEGVATVHGLHLDNPGVT